MDQQLSALLELMPQRVRHAIQSLSPGQCAALTELRLRVSRPCTLTLAGETVFLSSQGGATAVCDRPVWLSQDEMDEVYLKLCRNSVYARAQEIGQGFVTYCGCRAGLCGEAVLENGEVVGFRKLSAINLRIAREQRGAAKELLDVVLEKGRVLPTLLVAPPGCGKTTMLRDLCRLLALRRLRVAVIDERAEIAGEPGHPFDLGGVTEVLSGLPKAQGMELALRTLSPQVMVVDELGSEEEVRAMLGVLNAGVPVVASCHAASFEQMTRRPQFQMLKKACVVSRVVVLEESSLGNIKEVVRLEEGYDEVDFHKRDSLLLHGSGTVSDPGRRAPLSDA